jgi:hypothetical protein
MIDSFSRLLAQGWGNADVGGGWYASTGGTFRVDGARGIIERSSVGPANVVGAGPVHGASTMPGYGLDVAGLVSFRLDRVPDVSGSRHIVQVYARRNDRLSDGDYYYRFEVRVSSTSMDLAIEKNVKGALSYVTSTTSIAAAFDPNATWWIRWEAFGTSPSTTVRMRVWKNGTTEPTTWHRSAVINEPALDQSGTTGVRFSVPTSQTSFPVRLYVDDLQYTRKTP